MKNPPAALRLALLTFVAAGLLTPASLRAQSYDLPDRSGWFVRADAVARFNIKASVKAIAPASGPGLYDNGFVLPDIGTGPGSTKTWNWGYNSADQIVAGQLVLSRLDGAATIGRQNLDVSNPTLGGEVVAGYQFHDFEIGKKTARFGFEIGWGYSSFSQGMNFAAAGTATRVTDGYGLGGIVPPIAPYAGTSGGPGPLIDLSYGSHATVVSPATTGFQGKLDSTLQNLRLGPSFEIDLSKRLNVGLGVGYSSVYADAKLNYAEGITFANPAMPAVAQTSATIRSAKWRPGGYAELNLKYQITDRLGVFLGGDFQFNSKLTFGDAGHQVDLDLGMTYGAKAGLVFRF